MTQKKQPLRQCIGCGEMKAKKELVRIVKTPEGNIMLDHSGKANGRGAYICRSVVCYKQAVKAKKFEKAFSASIPDNVSAYIAKELDENE